MDLCRIYAKAVSSILNFESEYLPSRSLLDLLDARQETQAKIQ